MMPSPVEVFFALSMSLPDLGKYFGFGKSFSRQIEVEQFGDVPRAEQGHLASGPKLHLHAEKQCQTSKADVVMPASPNPNLILSHAKLALGLVECVFYPKSLPLHPCVLCPVLAH